VHIAAQEIEKNIQTIFILYKSVGEVAKRPFGDLRYNNALFCTQDTCPWRFLVPHSDHTNARWGLPVFS
jgi:hypothetical protein